MKPSEWLISNATGSKAKSMWPLEENLTEKHATREQVIHCCGYLPSSTIQVIMLRVRTIQFT